MVVLFFCCSSKAAFLSQVVQGTPRTSSAGFWFCTCLRITSSTSILTRAQGTSGTQVVLPCQAAQLLLLSSCPLQLQEGE